MADAADLKSAPHQGVWVRVPPSAVFFKSKPIGPVKMKCPFCGKDYLGQDEVMNCIVNHVRESQEEQARQMQRVYLMLMASQLTMASLATHSSARDVVERFGEIYELLHSLIQKPDVVSEIEKWLKDKDSGSEH